MSGRTSLSSSSSSNLLRRAMGAGGEDGGVLSSSSSSIAREALAVVYQKSVEGLCQVRTNLFRRMTYPI